MNIILVTTLATTKNDTQVLGVGSGVFFLSDNVTTKYSQLMEEEFPIELCVHATTFITTQLSGKSYVRIMCMSVTPGTQATDML